MCVLQAGGLSITPAAASELAMMSTHSAEAGEDYYTEKSAAGRTLCCRSSSCLQALDLINMADNVITHCQPAVEPYWYLFE